MQEDKIRAALVELLYRNSYGVVVANILISLAAAYVLVGCPGTACSSRSAARETQNIELTTACRWKSATTATPYSSEECGRVNWRHLCRNVHPRQFDVLQSPVCAKCSSKQKRNDRCPAREHRSL
jgi:hypothetical protein